MRDITAYIRLNKLRYLLCIISIPLICLGFFYDYLPVYFGSHALGQYVPSIFSAYDTTIQFEGFFVPLLFLIAGLPATDSFYEEYSSGIANYHIARSGIDRYLRRRSELCFCSSAGVIVIGLGIYSALLFILGILNGNPLVLEDDSVFFLFDHPVFLLLIKILLISFCGALWNMLALTVSCFVGNRYLILTVPIVIYFVLERISVFLPEYFNLYLMCHGYPVMTIPYPLNLLYSFGVFIGGSWLFGVMFITQGRKCVECEKIT